MKERLARETGVGHVPTMRRGQKLSPGYFRRKAGEVFTLEGIFAHCVARIVRPDLEKPCLEWQRARAKLFGYGVFGYPQERVHRYVYKLVNGEIPKDKPHVLHHCDNPPCCEPSHLWAGTPGENVLDCNRKGRGRQAYGEVHSHAKLSESDVVEILVWARAEECRKKTGPIPRNEIGWTQGDIGVAYGVSAATINTILNGRVWRRVQEEASGVHL